MNEAVQTWIERVSALPGVLGCGVRGADRAIIANTRDEGIPIPQVESAIREMLDVIQALQEARIATDRLCWTFENGRIHCAARADGVVGVLLLSSEIEGVTAINKLLSDFLSTES